MIDHNIDLNEYFNDNDTNDHHEFVDSSRKLYLIFEPDIVKVNSLALNVLECRSKDEINLHTIPYYHNQ